MTKNWLWKVLFLLLGGLAFGGQSKYNKVEYKGERVKAVCEITTSHQKLEKKANGVINMLLLQIEGNLSLAEDGKREMLADELFEDMLKSLDRLSRDAIKKIEKASGGAGGTRGTVGNPTAGGVGIIGGASGDGGGGGAAASSSSK